MKYALRVLSGVNRSAHYESARARAKKMAEGVSCRSESVRATKRRRRKFSLGRSHASDRGERIREARGSRKKWSSEASAVLRACERRNVGDVYSPWGDVTSVTEGNESHEARSSHKKSRGMFHGFFLCERRDSNPYARRHQILSLAWLPITTRSQNPSEDS